MRTTILTILILITISTSAQYVGLEWSKRDVQRENFDMPMTFVDKNYLEYKTDVGWIAYLFERQRCKWICVESQICMDSITARKFINEWHEYNWHEIAPNRYEYHTGVYDRPIQVKADWFGGNVIFSYKIK